MKIRKEMIAGFIVLCVLAVVGYFKCRDNAPIITKKVSKVIKEGWEEKETEKTSTFLEKANPFKKTPTKADTLLKDWPRGTKIIEIDPREKKTYIAIPPSGEVLTPEGAEGITVYEKPKREWGLEFRPFLGASFGNTGPGALAGVDVFKVWRVHTGLGLAANRDAVAGVGAIGVSVWRNVDVKGYGGATFTGERVFGGAVTIGIE